MTNVADAQAKMKKFTSPKDDSDLYSDVREVGENVKDLGSSLGNIATHQYGHAQDMATDALHETGDAIRRNPLLAVGISAGLGFVVGLFRGGRTRG